MREPDLDRLFRAAASVPNEPLPEMPDYLKQVIEENK